MSGEPPDRSLSERRIFLAGAGGGLFWFVFGGQPGARAQARFDRPEGNAIGRVARILDGDGLVLDDGRELRLAGIEAARPPRRDARQASQAVQSGQTARARRWPLAEAATRALSHLAQDAPLYTQGSVVTDRHGRLLAQVRRDDGLWLQGRLLEDGHARVRTRPDQTDLATDMLALESAARQARRGIWASRVYAPRPALPAALARDIGSFQIIEGRVLAVGLVDGGAYLNFGPDWRSDVAVRIERATMRRFLKAGMNPKDLEGQDVRVRGWIDERNGPLITATHPEQVERLGG